MHQQEKVTPMAWIMWFTAALFITYMFLLQTSTSVMIPNLMRDFDIDTFAVGLVSSAFFYTYIVLQVPAGILIDWYQPRRVVTCCILVCALGAFIFAAASNAWIAAIGRVISGAGAAGSVAGALFVGLRRLPASRFALVAGASEMLGMFGGAAGEAALAHSVSNIGWRHTVYYCVAAGIILAIATWLILQDMKKKTTTVDDKNSLRDNFACVLGIKQMWFVGGMAALSFAPLTAFGGFWAVPYLQKLFNVDVIAAGKASSMMFLGAGIGAPLIGYVSDRFCKRRAPMLVASLLALATAWIIFYCPPTHFIWMYPLILLFGIFSSAYVIPFALAKDIVKPHVQGTAMGFTNMMCILVGAPILQPLIGWLLKYEDPAAISTKSILFSIADYHIALVTIPLTIILSLVCLFFVKETHCQSIHSELTSSD